MRARGVLLYGFWSRYPRVNPLGLSQRLRCAEQTAFFSFISVLILKLAPVVPPSIPRPYPPGISPDNPTKFLLDAVCGVCYAFPMKLGTKLGAIFLLFFLTTAAMGQQKVRGYYRKDGTYVEAYTRRPRAYTSRASPSGASEATSESRVDRYSIPRTSEGRIKRSETSKALFKFSHPCPSTGKQSGSCPGYVIDHIDPLACGGADATFNMQWQTVEDGKAKDKWERKGCGK